MNAIVPLSLMLPAVSRVLWSDETIETVKRLSAEGKSATVIANSMRAEHPGVTRNAVIGKLNRLGIKSLNPIGGMAGHAPTRAKRTKEYPRGASGTARKAPSPVNPDQDLRSRSALIIRPTSPGARVGRGVRQRSERVERHVERSAAPVQCSEWITIVDLNESVCHFPRGNPQDLDTFRYCGASIGEGERYCGGHRRIMYRPAPSK